MNRKLLIALAALLSGAFAAPRADAAGGLYLGTGIGRSTMKDENPFGGEPFIAADDHPRGRGARW